MSRDCCHEGTRGGGKKGRETHAFIDFSPISGGRGEKKERRFLSFHAGRRLKKSGMGRGGRRHQPKEGLGEKEKMQRAGTTGSYVFSTGGVGGGGEGGGAIHGGNSPGGVRGASIRAFPKSSRPYHTEGARNMTEHKSSEKGGTDNPANIVHVSSMEGGPKEEKGCLGQVPLFSPVV